MIDINKEKDDKTINQQKTRKIIIDGVEKWECCKCFKIFNSHNSAGRHARTICFAYDWFCICVSQPTSIKLEQSRTVSEVWLLLWFNKFTLFNLINKNLI